MKSLIIAAGAAVIGLTMLTSTSTPASAAYCFYKTFKHEGGQIGHIQGYAHAFKLKNACKRARRECNRRLERAYRNPNKHIPRGVTCQRTGHS